MNSKTQSIISYLSLFWFVPYIFGNNCRKDFSLYHLKQRLGLLIAGYLGFASLFLSIFVAEMKLLTAVSFFIQLFVAIFGIIRAIDNVKKPLPIAGDFFEQKFRYGSEKYFEEELPRIKKYLFKYFWR